jgi:hypothetical protein
MSHPVANCQFHCVLANGTIAHMYAGKFVLPFFDPVGQFIGWQAFDEPPVRVLSAQEIEMVLDYQPLTRGPRQAGVPRPRASIPRLIELSGNEVVNDEVQESQPIPPARRDSPISRPRPPAEEMALAPQPQIRNWTLRERTASASSSTRGSSRSRASRALGERNGNLAPAPAPTPADASLKPSRNFAYTNDLAVIATLAGATQVLAKHKYQSPGTPLRQ